MRRGVLRSAKRLTRANSEFEKVQRQQRQATEELESKRQELAVESGRQNELRLELADAAAAVDVLRSRPEMQDVARLDQLRESIKRQRDELQRNGAAMSSSSGGGPKGGITKDRASMSEQQQYHSATDAAATEAAASAAPDSLVNRHRDLTKPLFMDGIRPRIKLKHPNQN